MSAPKLTVKQTKLLVTLAKGAIVAPWSSLELVKLAQMRLVAEDFAFGTNGRLHTSKIWTLTDAGRQALAGSAGE
ncbi:MAG: hypothetical protein VX205_03080 [Pseudomonadota bacterium]|nr:hypothetical protein [Pseudomonadota bacterium]